MIIVKIEFVLFDHVFIWLMSNIVDVIDLTSLLILQFFFARMFGSYLLVQIIKETINMYFYLLIEFIFIYKLINNFYLFIHLFYINLF